MHVVKWEQGGANRVDVVQEGDAGGAAASRLLDVAQKRSWELKKKAFKTSCWKCCCYGPGTVLKMLATALLFVLSGGGWLAGKPGLIQH